VLTSEKSIPQACFDLPRDKTKERETERAFHIRRETSENYEKSSHPTHASGTEIRTYYHTAIDILSAKGNEIRYRNYFFKKLQEICRVARFLLDIGKGK